MSFYDSAEEEKHIRTLDRVSRERSPRLISTLHLLSGASVNTEDSHNP